VQAVPISGEARFSGKVKVEFCRNLDQWEDVADYLQIPIHVSARFDKGNEPRRLWEYLERRNKLFTLPDVLDATNQEELAKMLRDDLR
jgi:hypothetical protein